VVEPTERRSTRDRLQCHREAASQLRWRRCTRIHQWNEQCSYRLALDEADERWSQALVVDARIRRAAFNTPDESYHGLVYAERFGRKAYIERCRSVFMRTMGSVLSPMSAFLLLQGVETVALRVERHVENGRKVAEFLQCNPNVAWVNYAGFADHPHHHLAKKYFDGKACSLITFGAHGGYEGGRKFYNALGMIKRLVNLGDAKWLACHPASTTHRQMPPDVQIKAGVRPEAIRLSIGIEHADDIIADLTQALEATQS